MRDTQYSTDEGHPGITSSEGHPGITSSEGHPVG